MSKTKSVGDVVAHLKPQKSPFRYICNVLFHHYSASSLCYDVSLLLGIVMTAECWMSCWTVCRLVVS